MAKVQVKANFKGMLRNSRDKILKYHEIIIARDFNARVGSKTNSKVIISIIQKRN